MEDAAVVLRSPVRGLEHAVGVSPLYPTQPLDIHIFNWPTENTEPRCCTVTP